MTNEAKVRKPYLPARRLNLKREIQEDGPSNGGIEEQNEGTNRPQQGKKVPEWRSHVERGEYILVSARTSHPEKADSVTSLTQCMMLELPSTSNGTDLWMVLGQYKASTMMAPITSKLRMGERAPMLSNGI